MGKCKLLMLCALISFSMNSWTYECLESSFLTEMEKFNYFDEAHKMAVEMINNLSQNQDYIINLIRSDANDVVFLDLSYSNNREPIRYNLIKLQIGTERVIINESSLASLPGIKKALAAAIKKITSIDPVSKTPMAVLKLFYYINPRIPKTIKSADNLTYSLLMGEDKAGKRVINIAEFKDDVEQNRFTVLREDEDNKFSLINGNIDSNFEIKSRFSYDQEENKIATGAKNKTKTEMAQFGKAILMPHILSSFESYFHVTLKSKTAPLAPAQEVQEEKQVAEQNISNQENSREADQQGIDAPRPSIAGDESTGFLGNLFSYFTNLNK